MITDALIAAERAGFTVAAGDGRVLRLSEAALDLKAFSRLTDGVLDAIATAPGCDRARSILDRLFRRDFYVPVGVGTTLRTRPLCVSCQAETDPSDRFCAKCGAPTRHREGVDKASGRLPPGLALTKAAAKKSILALVRPADAVRAEDVEVVATNITCRSRAELTILLILACGASS